MQSTEQTLKGNWKQLKSFVKDKWNQLTENDLRSFDGSMEQLVGVIAARTGEAREDISQALDEIVANGKSIVGRAAAGMREVAEQTGASVSAGYEQMAERFQEGHEQAEDLVRRHPTESVAVALGTGLIAGVIVGLVLRSR